MYQDLQNDSVECIRRLIAYSAYQIVILPKVNPFKPKAGEEPKAGEKLEPGQVSLDVYLAACKSVVATYSKDSSKLSARYTKFNQDWRLCQDNLKNAIATAKEVSPPPEDRVDIILDPLSAYSIPCLRGFCFLVWEASC